VSPVRPGEIRLRGVSRRFRVHHERNTTLKEALLRRRRGTWTDLWVLRDVDLDIGPGESVGIVGRNGVGKSTLLKLVAGIIPPQSGTVEAGGAVASMLELSAGFHPDFTGRENVFMQGALYGLDSREVRERLDQIVAFSELADYIDMPVKTYSSGMFMRLGFAVAAHVDADTMLLDEVLAVGDAAFQRRCFRRIHEHKRAGGTLLFVSHDQEAVQRVCDRAILIAGGRVLSDGLPVEVFADYNRLLVDGGEAAQAGQPAGAGAWGSRRISITGFRLVGPQGPTDRLASGDELSIEIDLEPREPVERPLVGVNVYGSNGFHLYGTNNRMDGFEIDRVAGPCTVVFTVPRLPLLEGSFLVSLTVCSEDESEIFHHLNFCGQFSVFGQGGGVGPLLVEPTWRVVGVDQPAAPDPGVRSRG
jgi:ABC-type polysaccharide/polyol phosphate transport system ATPase subunit